MAKVKNEKKKPQKLNKGGEVSTSTKPKKYL